MLCCVMLTGQPTSARREHHGARVEGHGDDAEVPPAAVAGPAGVAASRFQPRRRTTKNGRVDRSTGTRQTGWMDGVTDSTPRLSCPRPRRACWNRTIRPRVAR